MCFRKRIVVYPENNRVIDNESIVEYEVTRTSTVDGRMLDITNGKTFYGCIKCKYIILSSNSNYFCDYCYTNKKKSRRISFIMDHSIRNDEHIHALIKS